MNRKNMHEHVSVRSCKGLSGRRTDNAREDRAIPKMQTMKSGPANAAAAFARSQVGLCRK